MEERESKEEEVTIIDKDESAERVVSVVGGFVIEESVSPFPVRMGGYCSTWVGIASSHGNVFLFSFILIYSFFARFFSCIHVCVMYYKVIVFCH